MTDKTNRAMKAFMTTPTQTIRCDKCGLTFVTRYHTDGDRHKADNCGGQFVVVTL